MQTYTHRLGTTPTPFLLQQEDGTPWDLSDGEYPVTATLIVGVGASCVEVPTVVPDPIYGIVVPDGVALEALPPRVYRAHLHMTWADGTWEAAPEIAVNIIGGC